MHLVYTHKHAMSPMAIWWGYGVTAKPRCLPEHQTASGLRLSNNCNFAAGSGKLQHKTAHMHQHGWQPPTEQHQGGVRILQGGAGTHEDEIIHGGLDEVLAQEEAAEQGVLAQLRQRAACLERDLLQRSLDNISPNSKVHCKDAELWGL